MAVVGVVIVAIILFVILAPVVPTTSAGGSVGSQVRIHGSISFVLTRGFGMTYTRAFGYIWGSPPFP